MEWTDQGILIHARPLGESMLILNLLTRDHGRTAGAFRVSQKTRSWLQVGQKMEASWRARLETQLGQWSLEPRGLGASQILDFEGPLIALQSACILLFQLLPEGQAYERLFGAFEHLMASLHGDEWLEDYVRFEALLLEEMGYGLDLEECALSGVRENLVAVSPRTGRAVSEKVARPYGDKLLKLPPFLKEEGKASLQEKLDGLALTGYFLENYATSRPLPALRERLVSWVYKMEKAA